MYHSRARWSDLPPELWTVIFRRLETYIDVLRCRSVCRSWRTSLPPFNAVSPFLPLEAPWPPKGIAAAARHPIEYGLLIRQTIYRISPLHDHNETGNSVSSSSSSPAKGWFSMVQRRREGKLCFMRPLYYSYPKPSYYLRKEVNLLDFRVEEVSKSYTLSSTRCFTSSGIRKVVMLPDSPWIDAKNCTLLAIYENGKLGLAKFGDSEWTTIEKQRFGSGDVIASRGKLYAVDRTGVVFSIDPSTLKLAQICLPLGGSDGIHKHLVECKGGGVYVVDQFDHTPPCNDDFKVYHLDLELGRLKQVRNLGNEAFVMGDHGSFSVSGTDFEGVEGNCIYYLQSLCGYQNSLLHVFDLQHRVRKCLHDEQIFDAPPMFSHPIPTKKCLSLNSKEINIQNSKRLLRFRERCKGNHLKQHPSTP